MTRILLVNSEPIILGIIKARLESICDMEVDTTSSSVPVSNPF